MEITIKEMSAILEDYIRRKDSGVMFGVAGTGNILGAKSVYIENTGKNYYYFSSEKGEMEVGNLVMPHDVDCSLTKDTSNDTWYAPAGDLLPYFYKKVLMKKTEDKILRIVKQNVRGENPWNDKSLPKKCWEFAKYLSDNRSGSSYNIGIKTKRRYNYRKIDIWFLDTLMDTKDEDFIEVMDKIANAFIPDYHQAIKGWEEYYKRK